MPLVSETPRQSVRSRGASESSKKNASSAAASSSGGWSWTTVASVAAGVLVCGGLVWVVYRSYATKLEEKANEIESLTDQVSRNRNIVGQYTRMVDTLNNNVAVLMRQQQQAAVRGPPAMKVAPSAPVVVPSKRRMMMPEPEPEPEDDPEPEDEDEDIDIGGPLDLHQGRGGAEPEPEPMHEDQDEDEVEDDGVMYLYQTSTEPMHAVHQLFGTLLGSIGRADEQQFTTKITEVKGSGGDGDVDVDEDVIEVAASASPGACEAILKAGPRAGQPCGRKGCRKHNSRAA